MDEKCNGLILRLVPFRDTSLIIHWLTSGHGRLVTMAKGAKRPKSPFRGRLDLLFEVDFTFRRSRSSDMHTLIEAVPTNMHREVRRDIANLRLLAYATRFIEQTTEPENSLLGIHAILTTLLDHLAQFKTRPALVYALEMKLLNELGLAPALNESRLDDLTIDLLEQLSIHDWEGISELRPSKQHIWAMKNFLHEFLIHHLGKLPKGRAALLGS